MPVKPTEQEDEYFARQEFERRKKALAEHEGRSAEEERLRILDKCSRCQGVWLDVELEQLGAEDKGFDEPQEARRIACGV